MPATEYDSADLLRRCRRLAQQPPDDTVWEDGDWWDALTDAQAARTDLLAALVPDALLGAPALLASTDGGLTYGFGTDAGGAPVQPLGGVALFRTLADAARPEGAAGWGLTPGADFHVEQGPAGAPVVRIPIRTQFPDGAPAAVFAAAPGRVDLAHPPTLQPPRARVLCVYDAVTRYAVVTSRRDPNATLALADQLWHGVNGAPGLLASLRTQFAAAAGAAGLAPLRVWGRR